jgi:hypothetical protein
MSRVRFEFDSSKIQGRSSQLWIALLSFLFLRSREIFLNCFARRRFYRVRTNVCPKMALLVATCRRIYIHTLEEPIDKWTGSSTDYMCVFISSVGLHIALQCETFFCSKWRLRTKGYADHKKLTLNIYFGVYKGREFSYTLLTISGAWMAWFNFNIPK